MGLVRGPVSFENNPLDNQVLRYRIRQNIVLGVGDRLVPVA